MKVRIITLTEQEYQSLYHILDILTPMQITEEFKIDSGDFDLLWNAVSQCAEVKEIA